IALVHRAHDAGEDRAVADAGIEHPDRGRPWMNIGELHADALCNHPFLAAGADEQQILLAVVVETEVGLRLVLRLGGHGDPGLIQDCAPIAGQAPGRGSQPNQTAALDRPVLRHERAHALHGFHGHASADAQAAHELAVVDGAPTEGRFGHADAPAVIRDLAQQLLSRHVISSSRPPSSDWLLRRHYKMPRQSGSTTILPIVKVGRIVGFIPLPRYPLLMTYVLAHTPI